MAAFCNLENQEDMNRKLMSALSAAFLMLAACGENQAQVANHGAKSAAKPAPAARLDPTVEKNIRTKLEKAYAEQQIKVQAVYATPLAHLYEVVLSGKTVVYTDAQADYMLVGDFIDVKNRKSLTDERNAELSAVEFDSLPFDKAIKEVRGNGQLKIAVFSDPDCPYCKRLEHEFEKMTDITIYNFMMPLASLHPDAARKAEQIWCQPDRTLDDLDAQRQHAAQSRRLRQPRRRNHFAGRTARLQRHARPGLPQRQNPGRFQPAAASGKTHQRQPEEINRRESMKAV